MTRSKLGLLGLCAVIFGMMAMSASSAQAALSWLILDSKGVATELAAKLMGENDSTHYTLLTHAIGLAINITCNNFELVGVELEAGGKLKSGGKVKFTGCEAYETSPLTTPLVCHVHTAGAAAGTIETNAGKGELVLHEMADGKKLVLTKIEPKEGTEFVNILTESCVLPASNKITGVLYLVDCEDKATTHLLRHLVEQGPLTSLNYGTNMTTEHLETSLMGSGWIKLTGTHVGLLWGAMDA